ncbi:HECT-like ubiquitin-conjugating enzyme-binding-domain-containing protein, partial [Mycena olivaceomarginata]
MATLTRTATQQQEQPVDSLLTSSIPAPFPRELLQQPFTCPYNSSGPSRTSEANSPMVLQELMPSIAYVEKTCLMTHSMPSTPVTSTSTDPLLSALQTLLANLRNRDPPDAMVEIHGSSDTALIHELHNRVAQISHTLEPSDAHLAESIVSLLSHFNRLSSIRATDQSAHLTPLEDRADEPLYPPGDLFNTLKRQLSDLQVEHQSQQEPLAPNTPPVIAVEKALLWSKIDEELEAVVAMCKERTERLEHLPPQYDVADYQLETPPQYDSASIRSSHDEKPNGLQSPTLAAGSEKMRLDLEAVAMAIDRLYLVAPQLHNQRVELKRGGQGPASASAPASAVSRGKQKEKDPDTRDLENMLELIGRASERTLKDQSVILDGGMKTRLERARQRDVVKREAFVGHLADYSDTGRLHGQDAVLQPTGARTKNPDAMLTLPEFIREGVPDGVHLEDPKAMLTLPEFVKEALPPHHLPRLYAKKPIRTRSMSAPSMSWLRRPSSRSGLRSEVAGSTSAVPSVSESEAAFSVTYIAEHHENLQHILIFLTVRGATPGVDIEAESGAHTSLPLVLPGRTAPGKQHVRVQGAHYEIKLATAGAGAAPADTHTAPLLDATQLATAAPMSFISASCSLPVVQSAARMHEYRDLPSEHWEELVDAWMCHADQKLNARVMKHGRGGFWPEEGQALVGGSYILFEEEAMVKHHLCPADETKVHACCFSGFPSLSCIGPIRRP